MASVARRPDVLIVLHQEHSTPGRVGHGAARDGRAPRHPPSRASATHCRSRSPSMTGVVVFGGPMCANDDCDWIKARDRLARRAARGGKAFPRHLPRRADAGPRARARVFTYDDRRSEIGYFPIKPNAAGERLCAEEFPRCVYQWHSDGFDLPDRRRIARHRRSGFPQSGLSVRQGGGRPAVSPRSHLPHDLPVDPARGGAPDPTGRAAAARPSRRLVSARRPRRGLARGLPARLAGEKTRRARARAPLRTPRAIRRGRSPKRPSASPKAGAPAPQAGRACRFRSSSATRADAATALFPLLPGEVLSPPGTQIGTKSDRFGADLRDARFVGSKWHERALSEQRALALSVPAPTPSLCARRRRAGRREAQRLGRRRRAPASDRSEFAVGEFDPAGAASRGSRRRDEEAFRPRRAPVRSRAQARSYS